MKCTLISQTLSDGNITKVLFIGDIVPRFLPHDVQMISSFDFDVIRLSIYDNKLT